MEMGEGAETASQWLSRLRSRSFSRLLLDFDSRDLDEKAASDVVVFVVVAVAIDNE